MTAGVTLCYCCFHLYADCNTVLNTTNDTFATTTVSKSVIKMTFKEL